MDVLDDCESVVDLPVERGDTGSTDADQALWSSMSAWRISASVFMTNGP